jgi:hypothetical protein
VRAKIPEVAKMTLRELSEEQCHDPKVLMISDAQV